MLSSYLYCFSFRFSLIMWSPSILFSKHLTVLLFTGENLNAFGQSGQLSGILGKGKNLINRGPLQLAPEDARLQPKVSNPTVSRTVRSLCRLCGCHQNPEATKPQTKFVSIFRADEERKARCEAILCFSFTDEIDTGS